MKLPSVETYGKALGIFRIYVGLFWLAHGLPKFQPGFMPPDGFIVDFLNHASTGSTGLYHTFVVGIVLPNITLFANLVRLGEVLTGIVLVMGFQTRLGGLVGVILALNYLSAQGATFTLQGWASVDAAAFVLSLLNLVLPTGLFYGMDGLLRRSEATRAAAAKSSQAVQAEFVDEP